MRARMAEIREIRSFDLVETIFTLFGAAIPFHRHLKRLKRFTRKGLRICVFCAVLIETLRRNGLLWNPCPVAFRFTIFPVKKVKRPRKPLCGYPHRGFESHPLRHVLLIYKAFLAFLIFRVQMRVQG